MKAVELAYWLQGFAELTEPGEGLSPKQWECIKRHLALVFKHEIDPSYPDSAELTKIHNAIAQVGKVASEAKKEAHEALMNGPGPVMRC
jgi:hypothetical protein